MRKNASPGEIATRAWLDDENETYKAAVAEAAFLHVDEYNVDLAIGRASLELKITMPALQLSEHILAWRFVASTFVLNGGKTSSFLLATMLIGYVELKLGKFLLRVMD